MDACEFCERLNQHQEDRPWYDFHILDEGDHFVTVAALGSFVPGYVLIVPRVHVFSMASLDTGRREKLLEYERGIHERIARDWQPATLFEHGACPETSSRTGACVSHAHWHLMPGLYDFEQQVPAYQCATSFEAIVNADRQQGYLAFRKPSGEWHFNVSYRPPSQYYRRIIAAQLGTPEDWDYLGFPMLDCLSETIARMTGRQPADC